eukprot:COSAG06_NODE_28834_length_567_cov_0.863248_1_plen_55_part_01
MGCTFNLYNMAPTSEFTPPSPVAWLLLTLLFRLPAPLAIVRIAEEVQVVALREVV